MAMSIYIEYLRGVIYMPAVVLFELYCMGLGTYDFLLKKDSHVWDMATSTKKGINEK
jgi:hypothetical protein